MSQVKYLSQRHDNFYERLWEDSNTPLEFSTQPVGIDFFLQENLVSDLKTNEDEHVTVLNFRDLLEYSFGIFKMDLITILLQSRR